MSYQLSISTSSKQGSLCIAKDFHAIYSLSWHKHNAHAELITVFIEQALDAVQLNINSIDHFICDIGPGSFTGVRVATSSIKSLAYHQNKSKIISITANQLLAEGLQVQSNPVCTIINAQRNEFYTAFYEMDQNRWVETSEPRLMSIDQITKKIDKQHLLVGDGVDLFLNHTDENIKKYVLRILTPASDFPQACNSLLYAENTLKADKTLDWKSLEPLYIRTSSAEEKLISGDLEIARNYVRRKNK